MRSGQQTTSAQEVPVTFLVDVHPLAVRWQTFALSRGGFVDAVAWSGIDRSHRVLTRSLAMCTLPGTGPDH